MRSDPAVPAVARAGVGFAGLLVAIAGALVATVIVSISLGTVTLPVSGVWAVVLGHLTGEPPPPGVDDRIVWNLRTPRVLLAAVVGAGLSTAGVALQALVRNPLADPYMMGVSSGASLGAVTVLAFGSAAVAGLSVTGAAFAGAFAALAVVIVAAHRGGSLVDSRLLLAGVAVGYLALAGTSFIQLQADPTQLRSLLFWMMGSVAGARWPDLSLPAMAIAGCAAWLLLQGRSLNALVLGDDDAAALGVDVRRIRFGLLVVGSLLTATAVTVSGGIGFVGLMVPHATRLVVGGDHRRLLPASALVGAIFLVLVDLAARMVDRPNEYPISVFTAALGAPFFLWLMHRGRRAS
jgi:iron complex transport system permease protein